MLDFKKNSIENSKWIKTLPENHCVVQICLWCLYAEIRKIITGGKQKWPLCFSIFIFLSNQEQSCASMYLADQKILNVQTLNL